MKKQITHGEVLFFETDKIPTDAKKIKCDKDFFVVGESETHGNDHRISICEDVELFERDGIFYIKNNVPVKVYCPKEGRHDEVILEPSIWEVDKAKEYDYFEQELRNVRD